MPKLDRSGLGLLLSAGVAAWIVENDPFGVQEVQGKRASALNMPSLRSAPARPPCLLRARLAAPGGPALPGKRPALRAPCHGLGCSSPPPPRPPVTPAWTVHYSRAARLLTPLLTPRRAPLLRRVKRAQLLAIYDDEKQHKTLVRHERAPTLASARSLTLARTQTRRATTES